MSYLEVNHSTIMDSAFDSLTFSFLSGEADCFSNVSSLLDDDLLLFGTYQE